jgi:hypothetical protein
VRVELPGGEWAEFRELADLRAGDAKAIRRATKFQVSDGALTEISMGLQDDQMDALLARIITMWSYTHGHPAAPGSTALDDIPLEAYDALVEAAAPYKEAVDKAGKSTPATGNVSTVTSSPGIQDT